MLGHELYASHYRDGSLGTTFVVAGDGGTNDLVYLNRSRVDALTGFLGGLKRTLLEGRLSGEVRNAIDGVRKRLRVGILRTDALLGSCSRSRSVRWLDARSWNHERT
jgi:hypothetical protein